MKFDSQLANDPRRSELARQIEHWKLASGRLADLRMLASRESWESLEHYLGVALRQSLRGAIDRLMRKAAMLGKQLVAASSHEEVEQIRTGLLELRQSFVRTETTLDFFSDALATRSVPEMAILLRACDHLASRSMTEILTPLGHQVPAALTYLDKGLGASILKAGLRLWEGSVDNPVAAIRVTRHNLLRPTAVLHEAGHQVAHIVGWNEELASALRDGIGSRSPVVAEIMSGCASELAADGFGFVHAGFGAVAALHDVVDGPDATVFRQLPGDPHPMAYLRVLIGIEMCRKSYGDGPWRLLEATWLANHPVERLPRESNEFVEAAVPLLPEVVQIILHQPYEAFGGVSLAALLNPGRISPAALGKLERDAGEAAFVSPYWTWNEAIRLLALTAYRSGTDAAGMRQGIEQQEQWMKRTGALRRAA